MNKKGFTLIELLAVIIILGILMIIAIPSVTKYINDSRKNAYIDTAKEMIGSARNLVNEGKLEMFDTDTTYYINQECIQTENAAKSPYGDFTKAYVVVTYNGKGYDYYWTSVDDAGQGISKIIKFDNLDIDKIESDLTNDDIPDSLGVDGRGKYMIIDKQQTNCGKGVSTNVSGNVSGETGEKDITATMIIGNSNELVEIAGARRFVGANPKNFVWFNGELWRVIGIYNNKLKIIRFTLSNFNKYQNSDSYDNSWNSSLLSNYLNESYYDDLSNDAKRMIDTSEWFVGPIDEDPTAENAYIDSQSLTWNGKVGVVTAYEYLYATSKNCSSISASDYLGECLENNWIYDNNYHSWLMNPDKTRNDCTMLILNSGEVTNTYIFTNNSIKPVVYLNSSVKITGGSGTQTDPYILE